MGFDPPKKRAHETWSMEYRHRRAQSEVRSGICYRRVTLGESKAAITTQTACSSKLKSTIRNETLLTTQTIFKPTRDGKKASLNEPPLNSKEVTADDLDGLTFLQLKGANHVVILPNFLVTVDRQRAPGEPVLESQAADVVFLIFLSPVLDVVNLFGLVLCRKAKALVMSPRELDVGSAGRGQG